MPEENDIPVQTDTDASPAVTPEPHYTFGNNGAGGTTPLYPGSYDIIGALTGRREIVTAARVINQSNIIDELRKAVEVHEGDTPEILQKRVMEEAEWKILPLSIEKISKEILGE